MTMISVGGLRRMIRYRGILSSWQNANVYRRLVNGTLHASEPVPLRVREAGNHPLLCRPGTSDPDVLWDTFGEKYHLPPVALPADCYIVDLGANVGYTMAHFAFLYPRATVLGVELARIIHDPA